MGQPDLKYGEQPDKSSSQTHRRYLVRKGLLQYTASASTVQRSESGSSAL
jgi:hypothetical protein